MVKPMFDNLLLKLFKFYENVTYLVISVQFWDFKIVINEKSLQSSFTGHIQSILLL